MATKDELHSLRLDAYRIISENPTGLFPEFDFQRSNKGWCSGNSLKIDGSSGASRGKVWVYDNRPGYLFDYRGNISVSFWDYLEKVRHVSSPFTTLIEYAGLDIPSEQYEPTAIPELMADTHPMILKQCLTLFMQELASSTIGQEVTSYLVSRGYSEQDIKRMKLGALPELNHLHKALSRLPIDQKYINFFIKRMESYLHHRLTIPSYGKNGRLEGFVFRTIAPSPLPQDLPKYKNMANMNRETGILNIPQGCREIVIVEGILDSLLAKARNQRQVVPLNGSALNEDQLDKLAAMDVERIILCLDNDDTGKESTRRIVERALSHQHRFELYIVQLPDTVKDVDELLTGSGVEALQEAMYYAIGVGEYMANQLIMQFPRRDEYRPLPSLIRARLNKAAEPIQQQLARFPLELGDFDFSISAFTRGS